MKKFRLLFLTFLLLIFITSGCGFNNSNNENKIVVGASASPHAEILEAAKPILEKEGYKLVIREFTDYVQPNLALANGELDANYFQHKPYLEEFNSENKTNLVSMEAIHYEPFGIYPGKCKDMTELGDGAKIAVPNDTTNEARALMLLEKQGLIKLADDTSLKATAKDIVENPKNLKIIEIEAAQLARSLSDVDLAIINGNYAIEAGLDVNKDALAIEDKDSVAAETFANILAVRAGDENREDLKALIRAIKSEEVKLFIENKYHGAVLPMF